MDQKLSADAIGYGWHRIGRDSAPAITIAAIAINAWATLEGFFSPQVTIAIAVASVAGVLLSFWTASQPLHLRVRPEQWKPGDPTNLEFAATYIEVKKSAHGFNSPNFRVGVCIEGRLMMNGNDAHVAPYKNGGRVYNMVGDHPEAEYYVVEIRP